MKDYKSIIKYLETTVKLIDGDDIDRGHAKTNALLALMDLKALNRQQELEIADMVKGYK